MNATTPPLIWLGSLATVVLVVGCTADQRRGLGEEDARDALTMQIETALSDHGLALEGDLACHAVLTPNSAMTADCVGMTESGVAVAGTFDGTADADAETCSVRFVVEIDDEPVVDQPHVDCFDVR